MNAKVKDAAHRIADELAAAEIKLVASLPDDWIAGLIKTLEVDSRFTHVPVNREESAVGLCSGCFFSSTRALGLMGASGLMTCIYALVSLLDSINLPYAIVESRSELSKIRSAYRHTQVINRPVVVALTRDVLRGEA